MDKKTLIELAANSKMLKGLCLKLCNYRDIHDDLFQEFLLYLCERDEALLVQHYTNIQFLSYCSNVLRWINSDRLKANKLLNTKHPLAEKNFIDIDSNSFDIKDEDYNYDIDLKFKKTIRYLNDIKGGAIVIKSIELSLKQIAIDTGQTYKQVTYKNQQVKELVRKNIL